MPILCTTIQVDGLYPTRTLASVMTVDMKVSMISKSVC